MKKYTLMILVALSSFSCDMITKNVQSDVDDLKSEIQSLRNEIQVLQTEINNIEDSQQSDKSTLQAQIASLEQSIAELRASIEALSGTVDDIATLQALIADLEGKLAELKSSLAALESELDDSLAELESRLDVIETTIDKLGNTIITILGTVTTGMYEELDEYMYIRNEYIETNSLVQISFRSSSSYAWNIYDEVFVDYDFNCTDEGGTVHKMYAGFYYGSRVSSLSNLVYFRDLCRDNLTGYQIKVVVVNSVD